MHFYMSHAGRERMGRGTMDYRLAARNLGLSLTSIGVFNIT